jgi:hypothetical protein
MRLAASSIDWQQRALSGWLDDGAQAGANRIRLPASAPDLRNIHAFQHPSINVSRASRAAKRDSPKSKLPLLAWLDQDAVSAVSIA